MDWKDGLVITKDPDDVLDYKFDFSSWLNSGDTISTRVVTVSTGLTKDSDSITDTSTSVTVWLSGGTPIAEYTMACKITTADGRTVERSVIVRINDN